MRRDGGELQRHVQNKRQSAFGTRHEFGEVEGLVAGQFVQVIAADAPHDLRKTRRDLGLVFGHDAVDGAVDVAL